MLSMTEAQRQSCITSVGTALDAMNSDAGNPSINPDI